MKKRDYILAYILALTISFAVCYSHYEQKISCKCESILPKLQIDYRTLQGQINKIDVNKALLDKIDELTRQNERLIMEVCSQAAQLDKFEGMAEK
jgi:hypothetical protein